MEVFAVTVFVSLLFGVLFATLFVFERMQRGGRSLEQQALLPLDEPGSPPAGLPLEERAAEKAPRSTCS